MEKMPGFKKTGQGFSVSRRQLNCQADVWQTQLAHVSPPERQVEGTFVFKPIAVVLISSILCAARVPGMLPSPSLWFNPGSIYRLPPIMAEVQANNEKVQQLPSDEGFKTAQNVAAIVAGFVVPILWLEWISGKLQTKEWQHYKRGKNIWPCSLPNGERHQGRCGISVRTVVEFISAPAAGRGGMSRLDAIERTSDASGT